VERPPSLLRPVPGTIGAAPSSAWPVGCLLGLQLLITVPLAARLNLWVDEIYSLHTTALGPFDALARGVRFERQAPLYFGLLSLWRQIDGSTFFARLFSVLCIALSLLVVVRIARRLFPELSPVWFAAAFALHPTAIWAALEIRVYALAILLGGALTWAGLAAFFSREPRRVSLAAFVALSVTSIYTQYYLGFIVIALGVALIATRRTGALGRFALAAAAIGALCAPIAFWLPDQTSGYGALADRFGPLGAVRFWTTVMADELVPAHRLTHLIEPASLRWLTRGALFALCGAIVLRLGVIERLSKRASALAVAIVVAVVALQFTAVGCVVGRHLVEAPKYWSFLCLPATLALVSAAAVTGRLDLVRVVVGLLVAANAAELFYDYRALAKPTDMARVASFLMREEREGEPILVFPCEWALTLRHYYHGVNAIVPVPHEPSLDRWDPGDLGIDSEPQLRALLAQLHPDHGTIWLVRDDEINRGRDILDRVIDAEFVDEETQTFYRENRVLRLRGRSLGSAD